MSVRFTLHLACETKCGVRAEFQGPHFFDVQRDAMAAGWRFNAVGDQVWCPKCARRLFPMLFEKKKSSARKVSRR